MPPHPCPCMTAHALCFVQKQRGIQDSDDEEGETGKDAAAGDEDGDGPADGDGQEDEDEDGESVDSSGRMCDMAAAGTAVLGEATAAVDYDAGNIRTGPGSLPVEGGGVGAHASAAASEHFLARRTLL